MKVYAFNLVLFCLANDVRGATLPRQDAPSALELFRKFVKDHGKVYENETELSKRFEIFTANLETTRAMEKTQRGTAEFGITKFADWTQQEFDAMLSYGGPEKEDDVAEGTTTTYEAQLGGKLPVSYDWRDHKVVTPVRDQGKENHSWAFSVVSAIESARAVNRSALVNLSVQQFIDCCLKCDREGGLMYALIGVQMEKSYPYVGKQGKCTANPMKFVTRINGFEEVKDNEKLMAEYLYKTGPLSASVNANRWRSYKGGIYHPTRSECSPNKANHNVLIVGYGEEKSRGNKTIPYWIVKNSWGKDWGEKGYMRLYRGDGSCGVNKKVFVVYVYKPKK